MLTEEQKSRLNPDQLVIAEKWEREREERGVIIDMIGDAERTGNKEKLLEAMELLRNSVSDFCEHERSIWSSCAACDEIDRLLYPEAYCKGCDEHGHGELNQDGICPICSGDEQ